MTPKQILLLMRDLGVGKENFEFPDQAERWSAPEAAKRMGDLQESGRFPNDSPGVDTIAAWFSDRGNTIPTKHPGRRYFDALFFNEDMAAFGTREWKDAYVAACYRHRTAHSVGEDVPALPITGPGDWVPDAVLSVIEAERVAFTVERPGPDYSRSVFATLAGRRMAAHFCPREPDRAFALAFNTQRRAVTRAVAQFGPVDPDAMEPDWRRLAREIALSTSLTPVQLNEPERLSGFAAFQRLLRKLGQPGDSAVRDYSRAFHAELLSDAIGYFGFLQEHIGQTYESLIATLQFRCHHEFLRQQVEVPLFESNGSFGAEPMSLSDIFVDLPLIAADPERTFDPEAPQIGSFDQPEFLVPADILATYLRDDSSAPLIVFGGPGTGKSSLLKLEIVRRLDSDPDDDTAFLFLPLSRLRGDLGLDGSVPLSGRDVPGLLQSGTRLDLLGKLDASSFRRLVLLLDGLDEAGGRTPQATIIAEIAEYAWALTSAARAKPVRILISGRPSAFRSVAPELFGTAETFETVGMAKQKRPHELRYDAENAVIEEMDKRISFWYDKRLEFLDKYVSKKFGLLFVGRPEIISETRRHSISELTHEPLLLYLVLRLGDAESEKLNKFQDGSRLPDYDAVFDTGDPTLDRNDIYQRIIWSIRYPPHRQFGALERSWAAGGSPEGHAFEQVLGALAIAARQKRGGRGATVGDFLSVAAILNCRAEAERVVRSLSGEAADFDRPRFGLLSIFYFDEVGGAASEDVAYEFTHKSFSDYLVAVTLFRQALAIFADPADFAPDDPRLTAWADLAGAGPEDFDILEFLQDEARRLNADISKNDLIVVEKGGKRVQDFVQLFPPPGLHLDDVSDHRFGSAISGLLQLSDGDPRYQRAARVLFAVWNKRRTEGRDEFKILNSTALDIRAFLTWVSPPATQEQLHSRNVYGRELDFVGQSLDGWDFKEQDFSDLTLAAFSFHRCDLEEARFWGTTLAETSFSGSRLDGVSFVACLLEGAGFQDCHNFSIANSKCHSAVLTDCRFESDVFSASDFSGGQFEGCFFDGVTFENSKFCGVEFKECQFLGCTFLMCDFSGAVFGGGRIKNSTAECCRFADMEIQWRPDHDDSDGFPF